MHAWRAKGEERGQRPDRAGRIPAGGGTPNLPVVGDCTGTVRTPGTL